MFNEGTLRKWASSVVLRSNAPSEIKNVFSFALYVPMTTRVARLEMEVVVVAVEWSLSNFFADTFEYQWNLHQSSGIFNARVKIKSATLESRAFGLVWTEPSSFFNGECWVADFAIAKKRKTHLMLILSGGGKTRMALKISINAECSTSHNTIPAGDSDTFLSHSATPKKNRFADNEFSSFHCSWSILVSPTGDLSRWSDNAITSPRRVAK